MICNMDENITITELRRSVAEAARMVAHKGLVEGTAGNLSARLGDHIAITATGAELCALTDRDVTVVSLEGEVIEGAFEPTSEIDLHLSVYRNSALRAGAVVHCHAPYATAIACSLDELPVLHYEQLMLGGAIRVAPFAVFGTPELADLAMTALQGRKAALLANHGAIAYGKSLKDAVHNTMTLEWMCQLYCRASALGAPKVLSIEQQVAVAEHAFKTGYGTTKKR